MTPREEKESSYGVYFERDLEKAFDDLKEEPEDRDFAWNSELPEFIEEDIVYLTDNQDYEFIKYVFGNSEFYIKLDYQEPKLSFSVDDAENGWLGSMQGSKEEFKSPHYHADSQRG